MVIRTTRRKKTTKEKTENKLNIISLQYLSINSPVFFIPRLGYKIFGLQKNEIHESCYWRVMTPEKCFSNVKREATAL